MAGSSGPIRETRRPRQGLTTSAATEEARGAALIPARRPGRLLDRVRKICYPRVYVEQPSIV
jgi:hypothetical protein